MPYLARFATPDGLRFVLRESFQKGDMWQSRELFDFGYDPGQFLVYPGGNSFYVDEEVLDAIQAAGGELTDDDLEYILLPFVEPELRFKIEPFIARSHQAGRRRISKEEEAVIHEQTHLFDKRRLYYLRYGNIDQTNIFGLPAKLFKALLCKSRDEIEQYFLQQERTLEAEQMKEYLYVAFNLQNHFDSILARTMPAGLNSEKMDEAFIEEVCLLNDDLTMWSGFERTDVLPQYLARYVWLYFDSQFDANRAEQEFIRQFQDQHRAFRWPEKKTEVTDERLIELFGVDGEDLKKMSKKELIKLFRKQAHEHHPDKGGEHDYFVELAAAYADLLKGKK